MYNEVKTTRTYWRANNALHTHTHTQAQQPKWVVNNSIVTPSSGQVVPNNLGNTADHTQNAIWDKDGNLKIYAEDGFIYDATGQVLNPGLFPNPNHYGHSEFTFVPIPFECDKYYAFSVDEMIVGSVGEFYSGSQLALVYSIIDLSLNNGLGGVVPIYNSDLTLSFSSGWKILDWTRYLPGPKDNYHIGVTKLQVNGKRYLFLSGLPTLRVFEVTATGITEILEGFLPLWGSTPLRSELEIFEDDDYIIVAIPELTGLDDGQQNIDYYSGLDVISFYKPQPNTMIAWADYGQYFFSVPDEDVVAIKGVEFSPNGQFIYVTRVLKNDNLYNWADPNSVIVPTDLVYLERNSAGLPIYDEIPYPYGSVNLNDEDFSFGMLEVDNTGSLILAGNNRLGRIVDANNPNSTFNPNFVSLQNPITNHGLGNYDIRMRIHLLPDQIDGEEFNPEQFPETLNVCAFPYALTSVYMADWSIAHQSHSEPEEWIIDALGSGLTMEIHSEGYVYVTYLNENGCEITENIYVQFDPIMTYGPDFTFNLVTTFANQTELHLTPLVTLGVTHLWEIYEDDGNGNWVLVGSSTAQNPVFPNIVNHKHYQVLHEILAIQPYNCNYATTTTKTIQ